MIKLTDVEAVDLSASTDPPNRIAAVGIELEGGWMRPPARCAIIRDGSVVFPNARGRIDWIQEEFQRRYTREPTLHGIDGGVALQATLFREWDELHKDDPPAPRYSGEIPSPVLTLDGWEAWLRECYPSHVNATCGMHVHQSFGTPLTYQRLMNPRYPKTVIEEFKKWGKEKGFGLGSPLHERLYGSGLAGTPSEFCQPIFQADEQARRTEKRYNHFEPGCRYTVMNYSWSTENRRTIECRLLPMFEDVDVAVEAIKKLLLITNSFLYQKRKKEPLNIARIKSTGEELNRRIEVRI